MQLKLGTSHITHKGKVSRLRKLEYKYKKVEDPLCNLCGRAEEDCFHIMAECPHYNAIRRLFIKQLIGNKVLTRENYLGILKNLKEDDVIKVFKFFSSACKTRLFCYNEMGVSL